MTDTNTGEVTDIHALVATIADVEAAIKLQQIDRDAAIKQAIPEEYRLLQRQIEADFQETIDLFTEELKRLREEVKTLVLARGETVTAGRKQVVYYPGRVSYDAKKLDQLCERHPFLNGLRKQGEPYVAFKDVCDGVL